MSELKRMSEMIRLPYEPKSQSFIPVGEMLNTLDFAHNINRFNAYHVRNERSSVPDVVVFSNQVDVYVFDAVLMYGTLCACIDISLKQGAHVNRDFIDYLSKYKMERV